MSIAQSAPNPYCETVKHPCDLKTINKQIASLTDERKQMIECCNREKYEKRQP